MRRIMLGLVMISVIVSAAVLLGCPDAVQPAVTEDVNNKSFTFLDGAVFDPALAHMPTTLIFTNNATNFQISPATNTNIYAVGINTLNPCILTVTLSTFAPGTGPQANALITLNPCTFDMPTNTLIVGNGTITAISAPAVPL